MAATQADVGRNFFHAAHAIVAGAVQHAQQLHLHAAIQVSDFIQQERAAIRHLKQAGLGRIGSAEGAFFVAEQLAFEKIFGKRRAVDVHPGFGIAARVMVNGARDHFLAAAAFSGDQNGCVGEGDLFDLREKHTHGLARENRGRADELVGEMASAHPETVALKLSSAFP